MDCSLLTEEDLKRWREHTLEHLRHYPEFGKFNGEEKYTKIDGSADPSVRWAADEIVRLERELALANARIDYLMSPDSSQPEGWPIMPELSTVEIQETICDQIFGDWREESERFKSSCRSEAADIYNSIRAALSPMNVSPVSEDK